MNHPYFLCMNDKKEIRVLIGRPTLREVREDLRVLRTKDFRLIKSRIGFSQYDIEEIITYHFFVILDYWETRRKTNINLHLLIK